MSEFSPQNLLSKESREKCITNLKNMPVFFTDKSTKNFKQTASVLLPLCVVDNEVCLLYTLRSSKLRTHGMQVSFPGGKSDEGENVYETALRETEEEIGIPRDSIEVWWKMSALETRGKDIFLTPVVGFIKNYDPTKLKPSTQEVDEVFTVPLRALCDKNSHGYLIYENNDIPIYNFGPHKIWGTTGMITHLFLLNYLPAHLYEFDFVKKYELAELDNFVPSKL